jgi:hypothetical protein
MLLLSLAQAADTWPEQVVGEIEERAEEIGTAVAAAEASQNNMAVSCLAAPRGTVESSLLRAEAAGERWEVATDDGNTYAIESEVLALSAELERSRAAWYEAQVCWPNLGYDDPGRDINLPGPGPFWLSLGGDWHSDPTLADGGPGLGGVGVLGVRTPYWRWFTAGDIDAAVWAERGTVSELNHWLGADAQLSMALVPDRRVRPAVRETFHRDPRWTASPLGGTLSILDHEAAGVLQFGYYSFAEAGVSHRLQRVTLADGTIQQNQSYGPSVGWNASLGRVGWTANADLHRLLRSETGGHELRAESAVAFPLLWWLNADVGGGWLRQAHDVYFEPQNAWLAHGRLLATRDYSYAFVGWERDVRSDWLSLNVIEQNASVGFEGWLGARLLVGGSGSYGTLSWRETAVSAEPETSQELNFQGKVGLRWDPWRVEVRGGQLRRTGYAPAVDNSVGLHLVLGNL